MTFSQPMGFRMARTVNLPSVSRALERFGWPIWRGEVVRAVAAVTAELLTSEDDVDTVLLRLSHGQVGESDLAFSSHHGGGLLMRAADFLDVAHGLLHLPTAMPLPPMLDLRSRADFMDDPADPQREWVYVLFGTEHASLEAAFAQLRGIEPYPVPSLEDYKDPQDCDPDERLRREVWNRVLDRYTRFRPLSISAPEPQIAFDLVESLADPGQDERLATEGKVTLTAVLEEVSRRLGEETPDALRQRILAPLDEQPVH